MYIFGNILTKGRNGTMALPEVIKTAMEQLQHIARTETIFGEPVKVGDITLVPVSKVSVGFAAGGAGKDEKSASGAGTGGGVNVTPVALISVSGENVKVHSLDSGELDLGTLLAKAPDAIKKITKFFKKKYDKNDKDGSGDGDSGDKPVETFEP